MYTMITQAAAAARRYRWWLLATSFRLAAWLTKLAVAPNVRPWDSGCVTLRHDKRMSKLKRLRFLKTAQTVVKIDLKFGQSCYAPARRRHVTPSTARVLLKRRLRVFFYGFFRRSKPQSLYYCHPEETISTAIPCATEHFYCSATLLS